mmetsp:Transcript_28550/g.86143  ORF Transcript_28550/g.86143 Transcript_28550/m.86143 type:complete len:350 (-) Transcript_28550:271-1320(-)
MVEDVGFSADDDGRRGRVVRSTRRQSHERAEDDVVLDFYQVVLDAFKEVDVDAPPDPRAQEPVAPAEHLRREPGPHAALEGLGFDQTLEEPPAERLRRRVVPTRRERPHDQPLEQHDDPEIKFVEPEAPDPRITDPEEPGRLGPVEVASPPDQHAAVDLLQQIDERNIRKRLEHVDQRDAEPGSSAQVGRADGRDGPVVSRADRHRRRERARGAARRDGRTGGDVRVQARDRARADGGSPSVERAVPHEVAVDLGARREARARADGRERWVDDSSLEDRVRADLRAERAVVRVHEARAVERALQARGHDSSHRRREPPAEVAPGPERDRGRAPDPFPVRRRRAEREALR